MAKRTPRMSLASVVREKGAYFQLSERGVVFTVIAAVALLASQIPEMIYGNETVAAEFSRRAESVKGKRPFGGLEGTVSRQDGKAEQGTSNDFLHSVLPSGGRYPVAATGSFFGASFLPPLEAVTAPDVLSGSLSGKSAARDSIDGLIETLRTGILFKFRVGKTDFAIVRKEWPVAWPNFREYGRQELTLVVLPSDFLNNFSLPYGVQGEPATNAANLVHETKAGWKKATLSVYSDYYDGRGTASGQKFSQSKLTCAVQVFKKNGKWVPRFPFGTILEVRYGKKSVKVRVNDTFFMDRLDLSRAAMRALTGDNRDHLLKGEFRVVSLGGTK